MILLDHSPAEITGWDETAISRSRTKETAKLDAVMLLARMNLRQPPVADALPKVKSAETSNVRMKRTCDD